MKTGPEINLQARILIIGSNDYGDFLVTATPMPIPAPRPATPAITPAVVPSTALSSTPFFAVLRESLAAFAVGSDAPARIDSACANEPAVNARIASPDNAILEAFMVKSPGNLRTRFFYVILLSIARALLHQRAEVFASASVILRIQNAHFRQKKTLEPGGHRHTVRFIAHSHQFTVKMRVHASKRPRC